MKYLLLCFLGFSFLGCGGKEVFKNTQYPAGQNLYFSKCGGCHQLYDRNRYTPAAWDTLMNEMAERSKLTVEEKNLILTYLKER